MRTEPLSDALGARVLDFDITARCRPEEQAELRRLFIHHHLLLVRGQEPSNEDHNRFMQNFGMLSLPPGDGGDAGYVSNMGKGGLFGTGTDTELLWHADGAYGIQPGIATSLFAKEVAPDSAPTMFANAVRALDKLPRGLRDRIESLTAVHVREPQMERPDKPHREVTEVGEVYSCDHPVIYQPPHLEDKVLYVNRLMTSKIAGFSAVDSQALLEELFGHIYADDNIYTHRWELGDIVIWDNIALQHRRPKTTSTAPRLLRRLSLDGWDTGHGIMEWFAAGGKRDRARATRLSA